MLQTRFYSYSMAAPDKMLFNPLRIDFEGFFAIES